MTLILGVDLETTGLNPTEDQIIEVGAVLWCVESRQPVHMYSALIKGPIVPDDVAGMTGISSDMLHFYGASEALAIKMVYGLADRAQYLVAHNAEFEKKFLAPRYPSLVTVRPWIDTKTDLPFRPGKGNGTLNDIAMCHGVYNPQPHRALPDVLTMLQVLAQYPFEEVQRYALAATMQLIISFPYDETGQKNNAVRALGYYWNPAGKHWHKPVKDFFVHEEQRKAQAVGFTAHVAEKEAA